MFYTFADNMTLDETRAVINEHNEALGTRVFIEADRGDYVIFNYLISVPGAFPELTGDPVRDREIAIIRECRGLTFDKATGKVAVRKLQKFHNLGERPDTQMDKIDWSVDHYVMSKMDGSMLTPYRLPDGSWEAHTKMGATDVAKPVTEFINAHQEYSKFFDYCQERDATPLMEWCSRRQKIVVDYPEDMLVLLAVRDINDGSYLSYEELETLNAQFDIPIVARIGGKIDNITTFLNEVKNLEGEEGYIIRFVNGHSLKVKGDWYMARHNLTDMFAQEKNVLSAILEDITDDISALLDPEMLKRLKGYETAVRDGISATVSRLDAFAKNAAHGSGGDQKKLATEFVNVDGVPSCERGLIFQIVNGKDALTVVLNFLKKNVGSSSKVEEVRYFFNAKWDDYYLYKAE